MNELFTVIPPRDAFAILARGVVPIDRRETVTLEAALDRVAAEAVVACEDLPAFERATMDGYAVRSADTFGASDAAPAYLRLDGEVVMGSRATEPLSPGRARRVHTGAMLPPGADGVVIVEETNLRGDEVEVLRAAAPFEHVVRIGEDVRQGATLVRPGDRLRAQDLGALAALGVTRVIVNDRPRIAILSTGDEVVAPSQTPRTGEVRDVNASTIGAIVARAGGLPLAAGIVRDDDAALFERAEAALAGADALVLSAGSSVSSRDMTARIVGRLGSPGVLAHGIALRPGKPTVIAICDGKPVIGLPGNPTSAFVVAWRLVRPLIRALAGEPVSEDGLDDAYVREARVTQNVPSRPGREDYVPATLRYREGELEATPVFAKSSLIFALARSQGLIVIPLDAAGVTAGSRVRVVVP